MPDKLEHFTNFSDNKLTDEQRRAENKARFDAKLEEMRNSNPTKKSKKDYYQRERSLFNDLER